MKRKVIIILAVVVIIVVTISTIFIKQVKESARAAEQRKKIEHEWTLALKEVGKEGEVFSLSNTTPFEWDELYVVSGYYDLNVMIDLMGDKYKKVYSVSPDEVSARFMGTDLSTSWVFFYNGELVFKLETFYINTSTGGAERYLKDAKATVELKEGSDIICIKFKSN